MLTFLFDKLIHSKSKSDNNISYKVYMVNKAEFEAGVSQIFLYTLCLEGDSLQNKNTEFAY